MENSGQRSSFQRAESGSKQEYASTQELKSHPPDSTVAVCQ